MRLTAALNLNIDNKITYYLHSLHSLKYPKIFFFRFELFGLHFSNILHGRLNLKCPKIKKNKNLYAGDTEQSFLDKNYRFSFFYFQTRSASNRHIFPRSLLQCHRTSPAARTAKFIR